MYGMAVFEVIEVRQSRGHGQGVGFLGQKNQNKCKKSNNQLCLMLYGHFPAKNGSKSTTYLSKSEIVNKAQGWTQRPSRDH